MSRICILAHFAYGAMTGGQKGHIGGVERQTSLLACWLATRGHQVSLVTWDEGQAGEEIIDGVRVIKLCRRDAGIPGLRFFYPRWSSLNKAMRGANAELYYHNCPEYVTGQVALWCQLNQRKFIYSTASTLECDPNLPRLLTLRERMFFRYGLSHADYVICQTSTQQRMLRSGFGLDAQLIPMPCPGPSEETYICPPPPNPPRVLWVGRIDLNKRVEWLLDIAEMCPDINFDVVGPIDNSQYAESMYRRGKAIKNVIMYGAMKHSDMPAIYREASLLCSTSRFEGFPNTYLEAWSHGRPVVATIDPDGLIASRGLGGVGGNTSELRACIDKLLNSSQYWQSTSRKARRYYLENHTVESVMGRFERIFCEVIGTGLRQL